MKLSIPRQAGACVRIARRERGLTQPQLAAISGVSLRTIVSLEKGDSPGIRLSKLMSLLDALGLTLSIDGFGEEAAFLAPRLD